MSRIILKLSGEALAGEKHHGFDEATVIEVAKHICPPYWENGVLQILKTL